MIIIGNSVEQELLDFLLLSENLYLRLFTNNLTVNNSTILANFTEMSGIGYVQKNLAPASWIKYSNENGSYYEYPVQTWAFSPVNGAPAVLIYGWYLVGVTSGKLRLAERFEGVPDSILYGVKNTSNLTLRIGID